MIGDQKIKKILYGGDYNPEQWPQEIWQEDMRMLKRAGIDIVTLNVFSWASLQPNEDKYDFQKLDKIMELAKVNNLFVCLATSTGAHPAWMARKYPDIVRTNPDGVKRKFGGRHNSCPNSPTYQKYSVKLAEQLALRYGGYENIAAWHVSNEFGGECYCENCEQAFRDWTQRKYQTLDEVNRVWNMAFWGHTLHDWDDIVLPDYRSEHFGDERTQFQGISLDYRRCNSEAMLECYKRERDILKQITPNIPVTTNLMGFYKLLDYQDWAEEMDFISWDNYPDNEDPASTIALSHDINRGLKDGMPFVLMEQTPSVSNWLTYNALKRPGVMRLWSYQAVAHGADAVMFFQMRRSIGACEKYHGAVIDHVGHEHTRVFREIAALGKELQLLGSRTLLARTEAKIAILMDWDNWWALEYSAGPSRDMRYLDELKKYYAALYARNYAVDIISIKTDLAPYKIVITPILYMTKEGFAEKLKGFTAGGGTVVTTYFSGIVDEHDLVITGGYPGELRDLFGIWVEEIDALPMDKQNSFTYEGEQYEAELLCDIMHLETAEALAFYERDFYAGTPVITRNKFKNGEAYYIGTRSTDAFYPKFLDVLCMKQGIKPEIITPKGVEGVRRISKEQAYLFLLNHNDTKARVVLERNGRELLTGKKLRKGAQIKMMPKDVMIIEEDL